MTDSLHVLALPGRGDVPYTVRRSARARRVRVCVGTQGVLLIVPERMSLARAQAFLLSHSEWISRRLEAWSKRPPAATLPPNQLLLFAAPIPLRLEASISAGGRAFVHHAPDEITVRVPGAEPRLAVRALEAWMKIRARRHFQDSVARWTAAMDLRATGLSIRGQRSRWGSCTAAGRLSFNWRALLTPVETVEYLVVHECAHLRHLNHGPHFWDLVERHCPGFRTHRARLRQSGHLLDKDGWVRLEPPRPDAPPIASTEGLAFSPIPPIPTLAFPGDGGMMGR